MGDQHRKWTADALPDLNGSTVIVTGATSGLGLVTTRRLAARGARVIAAVRDPEKAQRVLDVDAVIERVDLADLASVRSFAERVQEPVDVLVNNAGIMATPLRRTADGFESQFATNHLGHFALTGLLIDRIRTKVVTVSSTAHRIGRIRFDDPNWERSYQRWAAYGQSKLANLLFTSELQRRLVGRGSAVRALAVHPGYAATELQSSSKAGLAHAAMSVGNRLVAQSAEAGAWPTLFAIAHDLEGDSYVGPGGLFELRGHPTLVGRSRAARDVAAAGRLWDLSETLTGVKF